MPNLLSPIKFARRIILDVRLQLLFGAHFLEIKINVEINVIADEFLTSVTAQRNDR